MTKNSLHKSGYIQIYKGTMTMNNIILVRPTKENLKLSYNNFEDSNDSWRLVWSNCKDDITYKDDKWMNR